jgi:hypothetical protein
MHNFEKNGRIREKKKAWNQEFDKKMANLTTNGTV